MRSKPTVLFVKIRILIKNVVFTGHSTGEMAPGMKGPGILEYKVVHNLILAHARAYRLYHKEFHASQRGQVGITLNIDWYQPHNETDIEHIGASQTLLEFQAGWFANPIFVDGEYPDIMRSKVCIRLIYIVVCTYKGPFKVRLTKKWFRRL